MNKHIAMIAAAAALAFSVPVTRAQTPIIVPKGTWDIETHGSYAKDWDRGDSYLATGTVGVGYYFADNHALNLELSGYSIDQPESAWGGGLVVMERAHFFSSGRLTLYADVGGGVFQANQSVPAGGTHFNFTFQTGLGMTWRLDEDTFLIGGVHYFHLSNASIRGRSRNPSLNGLQGYVGVMWMF